MELQDCDCIVCDQPLCLDCEICRESTRELQAFSKIDVPTKEEIEKHIAPFRSFIDYSEYRGGSLQDFELLQIRLGLLKGKKQ